MVDANSIGYVIHQILCTSIVVWICFFITNYCLSKSGMVVSESKTDLFVLSGPNDFICQYSLNEQQSPTWFDYLNKLSIQLYKLYNSKEHSLEWILLNWNQILTSRQTLFSILNLNMKKVGLNIKKNGFSVLNGKIPLDWFYNSSDSFKVKCKRLLL